MIGIEDCRWRAAVMATGEAVGALALGMAGQVIYHLLAAAHASRAPWPVVVLVSCLPVVMLGFGAALAHLLHTPPDELGETAPVPTEPAAVTAAGNPLSQRQLTSRFGLTRPTAAKVGPAGGRPRATGAARPPPRGGEIDGRVHQALAVPDSADHQVRRPVGVRAALARLHLGSGGTGVSAGGEAR